MVDQGAMEIVSGGRTETSFRDLLRQEYGHRQARHPRYSWRSFAKTLGLSPGHLSDVLKGRRSLSESLAMRVAAKLGFGSEATADFVAAVHLDHARDEPLRRHLCAERLRLRPVSSDDGGEAEATCLPAPVWHYAAVAELFACTDFVPSSRWMARKLKLTVLEVEQALAWLRHAGVIEGSSGAWRKGRVRPVLDMTDHAASGHAYGQMLAKAHSAVGQEDRELGLVTLAFSPDRLPEAIQHIRRCQKAIAALASNGDNNAVYQFGVQFFRLDDPSV